MMWVRHSTPAQGRGALLRARTGAASRARVGILSCDRGCCHWVAQTTWIRFLTSRGPAWSALVRALFPVSALPTMSRQGERRAFWSLPLLDSDSESRSVLSDSATPWTIQCWVKGQDTKRVSNRLNGEALPGGVPGPDPNKGRSRQSAPGLCWGVVYMRSLRGMVRLDRPKRYG